MWGPSGWRDMLRNGHRAVSGCGGTGHQLLLRQQIRGSAHAAEALRRLESVPFDGQRGVRLPRGNAHLRAHRRGIVGSQEVH